MALSADELHGQPGGVIRRRFHPQPGRKATGGIAQLAILGVREEHAVIIL